MAEGQAVLATFLLRSQAQRAVESLLQAGFAREDISLVLRSDVPLTDGQLDDAKFFAADRRWEAGEGSGTALGGLAGMLAGLAAVGGFLAAGPLAAALAAVGGGLLGALLGHGVPREKAQAYEARISRGDILVAVHTPPATAGQARQLLTAAGGEAPE